MSVVFISLECGWPSIHFLVIKWIHIIWFVIKTRAHTQSGFSFFLFAKYNRIYSDCWLAPLYTTITQYLFVVIAQSIFEKKVFICRFSVAFSYAVSAREFCQMKFTSNILNSFLWIERIETHIKFIASKKLPQRNISDFGMILDDTIGFAVYELISRFRLYINDGLHNIFLVLNDCFFFLPLISCRTIGKNTSGSCNVSNETNDSKAAINEIHTHDETTDVVRVANVWCSFFFKCVWNSNSK